MVKQCASCHQAFPSFDGHLKCAHCRYAVWTCQLDASNPCKGLRRPGGSSTNPSGMLGPSLRDAEVSVQEPLVVTSSIMVIEQAPTLNTMVPALQCAMVLTCAPLPLHVSTVSAPPVVQSTSAGAPMLIPGTFLPPRTPAPITMQVPAFLPMARTPVLPPVTSAPIHMQGPTFLGAAAELPPMEGAPMHSSQGTPFPGAYMAPSS